MSPECAPTGHDHTTTLNLVELLTMLKEAKLLDDICSARAVTTFFVQVGPTPMACL